MIKYRLRCGDGHVFDHWFESMAACENQLTESALGCPECGNHDVAKTLMAPNIGGGTTGESAPAPAPAPCGLPACAGGGCAFN